MGETKGRMWMLLKIKGALLRFYAEFEIYLTAFLKFVVSFTVLYDICRTTGYLATLGQIPLLLIAAAACSFLPASALILTAIAWLGGQFYGHSMTAAIVGGAVLLIFGLLYVCFASGHAYVTVLTALAVSLRIPLVVPLVSALLMGPDALPGILLGTGVCYVSRCLLSEKPGAPASAEILLKQVLTKFRELPAQPEMILALVELTAVFLVVWLIRRMSLKYCWTLAIFAGALTYSTLTGMGAVILKTGFFAGRFAADLAVALLSGFVVKFFRFHLDYRKVEYLQFEDDEYYYYVKAVAKFGADDGKGEEDEER